MLLILTFLEGGIINVVSGSVKYSFSAPNALSLKRVFPRAFEVVYFFDARCRPTQSGAAISKGKIEAKLNHKD